MKRLLSIILPATLAMTGCSFGTAKKKKKSKAHVIQIKGDPLNFVKGRRMTRVSSIRQDQIDVNAVYQVVIESFENRLNPSAATFESKKKAEDPSHVEKDLSHLADSFYRFQAGAAGELNFAAKNGQGLSFQFTSYAGYWELASIHNGPQEYTEDNGAYKLLNYSSTPDGARHSLLIYSGDTHSQKLIVVWFARLQEGKVKIQKGGEPYNYLHGRGAKVGWSASKPVPILFCTPEAPDHLYSAFQRAVRSWQQHLEGRLELETRRESFCPSFDDVNTRTFGYVPGWIEIPGHTAGQYGLTVFHPDYEKAELIDSDMFLFSKEIQEALDFQHPGHQVFDELLRAKPDLLKVLNRVTLHELGHFLGLHHVFNGPPSIMDYADIFHLTDYDKNAVQALYPLKY